jgi:hypothetical protein
MYSTLSIKYADPDNLIDTVILDFELLKNPGVSLWIERFLEAQTYPIDDPRRFYGFGPLVEQQRHAVETINYHVDTINNFKSIIDRKLTTVDDQDTLNYLHWCFETYHGHLDQQQTSLFSTAPDNVKFSLAELNVAVHRCESVARGAKPRQVITYYGLPKTVKFEIEHYQYFTDITEFGTAYVNYAEIGKTLEDLARDNDTYITDQAFKPFRFCSADFNIAFYSSNINEVQNLRNKVKEFYYSKEDFFKNKGFTLDHPFLTPGKFPIAKIKSSLSESQILDLINGHQFLMSVSIS